MAKDLTIPAFDYSVVDSDTKGKLIWYAGEIRRQGVTHVESGIEMGRLMSEAKELCGDKPFRTWVDYECGFSLRTAYNYITAYDDFGSCANFAQIELSAMYALASNPDAKKKAIKLANKGRKVTHALAKKLVEETESKETRGDGASGGKQKPDSSSLPPTSCEGDTPQPPPNQTTHLDGGAPWEEPDYGKCPNCAGEKWEEDKDGAFCEKCHHPHGEPAGDVDEERIKTQRQKTVKTIEALMRAFDDLQLLLPHKRHENTIVTCKVLLEAAKEWK